MPTIHLDHSHLPWRPNHQAALPSWKTRIPSTRVFMVMMMMMMHRSLPTVSPLMAHTRTIMSLWKILRQQRNDIDVKLPVAIAFLSSPSLALSLWLLQQWLCAAYCMDSLPVRTLQSSICGVRGLSATPRWVTGSQVIITTQISATTLITPLRLLPLNPRLQPCLQAPFQWNIVYYKASVWRIALSGSSGCPIVEFWVSPHQDRNRRIVYKASPTESTTPALSPSPF